MGKRIKRVEKTRLTFLREGGTGSLEHCADRKTKTCEERQ
jgi:hypothetical protein